MSTTLAEMRIGNPSGNVGVSGTIRYYSSADFTALNGTKYKGGSVGSKDYFLTNTWTVSGGDLIVPAKAGFPTTADASPGTAKITAAIYDSRGRHLGNLFEGFSIPADPAGPHTLLFLQSINAQALPIRSIETLSKFDFLLALDSALGTLAGSAGGDLSGSLPNPIVDGLQGRPVLSTAPLTRQALVYNGSAWAPGTGSQSSAVDVSSFATGGAGTSVSPWTGWDTAITWTAHTEYHFRKGYYGYTTAPNFGLNGIAIIGEAGTYFKHQGTGNAFVIDAGPNALTDWIQGTRVENIGVLGNFSALSGTGTATIGTNTLVGVGTSFLSQIAVGNSISFPSNDGTFFGMNTESHIVTAIADDTHLTIDANWRANRSGSMLVCKTTNGFFIRGTSHGRYTQIGAHDVGGSVMYTERMNNTIIENFRASYNDPTTYVGWQINPQYGIQLHEASTTNTFIDPIVGGGVEKTGFWIRTDSFGNVILNGSMGAFPGKALVIDSNTNTVIMMDIEANAGDAINLNGSKNTLLDVYSFGEGMTTSINAQNKIDGGLHYGINIALNADFNQVTNVTTKAGGFTDNSPNTMKWGNNSTITGYEYRNYFGNIMPRVVTLSESGGLVATDASRSSHFYLPVFGNFTLSNPTNPTNGQRVSWAIQQGGAGGFTITYGAKFRRVNGGPLPVLQPAVSAYTYITAIYNASDDKWDILDEGSTGYDASPAFVTLTDGGGATVSWVFTPGTRVQNATVTLGGNRTLDITGAVSGARGLLKVVQDATGSRALTLPAGSKVEGGGAGAIVLTATANAIDIIEFHYDGTNYFWRKWLNFT